MFEVGMVFVYVDQFVGVFDSFFDFLQVQYVGVDGDFKFVCLVQEDWFVLYDFGLVDFYFVVIYELLVVLECFWCCWFVEVQ